MQNLPKTCNRLLYLNHRVYNDAPRRLRWRSSLITTKYPELVLGPRGMPMVVRKIGAQLHLGVHNAQVVYFFFSLFTTGTSIAESKLTLISSEFA